MIDRPDYTRVEKPNTRGKVLGGSSCLNYYTWVRGSKGTFDDWEEWGGRDWNWDGVKEYFDKVRLSAFFSTHIFSSNTFVSLSRIMTTTMSTSTLGTSEWEARLTSRMPTWYPS